MRPPWRFRLLLRHTEQQDQRVTSAWIRFEGRRVGQLGDRRRDLRDLFVVGADLAFALGLALLVKGSLQLDVAVRRRIPRRRRIVGAVGKLGFAAGDLRIEAGNLLREGADIGCRERRIESSWASVLSVAWTSGSSVGQLVYASGRWSL